MSIQKMNRILIAATAATLLFSSFSSEAIAEQPEDAWITTKAKTELLTDDLVNGIGIRVDTFDARVSLYGKVETEAQKAQAERRVRSVKGVVDVRNLLVVVPEAARKATKLEDSAIKSEVERSLKTDPGLADSSIRVKSVDKGLVLLSGKATTLTAHRRAITRARRVEGVQRVASEIESPDELADIEIWNDAKAGAVETSAFSDAWITTKAKLSLMKDAGMSPMAVHVDTEDGIVTLFGTVNSAAEKTRAAAEVANLDGVKHVTNELQIVPAAAAAGVAESDDRVTAAVRKRLDGRASLDDSNLKVETAKGVVRLTGDVASHRDHLTALTTARGTPGVTSIIDDIELQTAPM
jgi:hyperosmotically inducible periplasmic protein